MSKGWFNNRYKHRMAAMGIRTTDIQLKINQIYTADQVNQISTNSAIDPDEISQTFKLIKIPITSIIYEHLIDRKSLIEDYGNVYSEGIIDNMKLNINKLPPIIIIHINDKYILPDGQHRLVAHKELGYKYIKAFVPI